MKKILSLVALILVLSLALVGCGGTTPPGTSWSDKEILVYDVFDGETAAGTLTATLERNPTNKSINGTDYNTATSRLTLNYTFGEESVQIESLLNDFSPVATYKAVSTANKNYTLSSYYLGKYYYYTLNDSNGQKVERIKTKGEFIDNDLLYTYLRCQNIAGINKTLSIPDAASGSFQSYTAKAMGTEDIVVPFPDGDKTVPAHKIAITRTATPIGESVYIYFTPDTEAYTISGGLTSLNDSRKIPVKIKENNMTYIIKSITVI